MRCERRQGSISSLIIFRLTGTSVGNLNDNCGKIGKMLGGVSVKKYKQVLNGNSMSCL